MDKVDPLSINLFLNELYEIKGSNFKYIFLKYCKEGNYEKVKTYLRDDNPLIHTVDDAGNTGFHLSCFYGYDDIVELFINHKNYDLNKTNDKGRDGFMLACYAGNINIVEMLVKAARKNSTFYNKFKRRNIDFNKKDDSGKTPFIWACYNNRIYVVGYLLTLDFIDVNATDEDKVSSFYYACIFNHINIINLLINNDRVNVNVVNGKNNPLLFVICKGIYIKKVDLQVLSILLKSNRVNTNVTNSQDENIFKFCIRLFEYWKRIDYEMIHTILEDDRIDVNNIYIDSHLLDDQNVNTPFMLACLTGDVGLVNLLMDYDKIDVNMKVESGENALYRSFQNVYKYGDTKILSLFINSDRIDLNSNPANVSILLLASPTEANCLIGDRMVYSGIGSDVIFKTLLQDDRVDINKSFTMKNKICSPFLYFCYNSDIETIKIMLRSPKLHINCSDEEGNNAFIISCINKNIDLIKLLHGHKIDIHHKNKQGYGALYYSIVDDHNSKLLCSNNKLRHEINKSKSEIIKLLIIYGLTLNNKEYGEMSDEYTKYIDQFPKSMEFFIMRNKIVNEIKEKYKG